MLVSGSRNFLSVMGLVVLSGCATSMPPVDMSFPSDVKTELAPDDEHAVLVLKSNGSLPVVRFHQIDSEGKISSLGNVFEVSEAMVASPLPAMLSIMKATNKSLFDALPVREVLIGTSKPIRISGGSNLMNKDGSKMTGRNGGDGCGPLYSTFRPEPMKRYMVRFSFVGNGCIQQVFDITASEAVLISGRSLPR